VSAVPALPTLVAIDTATEVCSVALLHAGAVSERAQVVGQGHSECVLPMVQALLADAALALRQCDAIAFGAGPGSFTGLRIACGVAQGLAWGIERPVLPVSNLAALALAVFDAQPQTRRVAATIDARMNEVYWAVYEQSDGLLIERVPPSLSPLPSMADELAPHAPEAVGGSALRLNGWPAGLGAARHDDCAASARHLLRLAERDWHAGRALAPALAAPLYVRDPVALTIDERRAAALRAAP
jgi:tRNA threonylcarbamoyladenosine biosynthesis protein TsaB